MLFHVNDRLVVVMLPGNAWVLICCAWHQWALDKGLLKEEDERDRHAAFIQLLTLLSAARQGASPALDDVLTGLSQDIGQTLREHADQFLVTKEVADIVEALVTVCET